MVFREVTVIETKEVLRLWRSGVAKKRIAAQLGVDVKTVRGYVKVAERLELDPALDLEIATAAVVERLAAANRRPRGPTWEVCAAHAGFIRAKLEDGVRLTKIRKLLLRQRQAQVSYMTLYRYAVRSWASDGRSDDPVTDCGGRSQLDTGWVGWLYDMFDAAAGFGRGSSRRCARGTLRVSRIPRDDGRRSKRARGGSTSASSRW
jgi:hypothetical protein